MVKPNSEVALAAFMAARISLEKQIPATTLARQMNIDRSSVTVARLIVTFGTTEEINAAEHAKVGLRVMADKIRARMSPEQRSGWQNQAPVFSDERREASKDDGTLWHKLRPAIVGLTELPTPKDMVALIKRNHLREATTRQNLASAFKWMEEFVNEWNTANDGSRSKESDHNPGGGSETA